MDIHDAEEHYELHISMQKQIDTKYFILSSEWSKYYNSSQIYKQANFHDLKLKSRLTLIISRYFENLLRQQKNQSRC